MSFEMTPENDTEEPLIKHNHEKKRQRSIEKRTLRSSKNTPEVEAGTTEGSTSSGSQSQTKNPRAFQCGHCHKLNMVSFLPRESTNSSQLS